MAKRSKLVFDVESLDKLSEKQLNTIVSQVMQDKRSVSAVKSMMKSMMRSAVKSAIRTKTK
jgi:hypothetical protein